MWVNSCLNKMPSTLSCGTQTAQKQLQWCQHSSKDQKTPEKRVLMAKRGTSVAAGPGLDFLQFNDLACETVGGKVSPVDANPG